MPPATWGSHHWKPQENRAPWSGTGVLVLTGSRAGSWGNTVVGAAAGVVAAAAVAGGISGCSVSVAPCGNRAVTGER